MTRQYSDSYGTTDDGSTTPKISPAIPESCGITQTDPDASLGKVTIAGHNPITEVWQDLVEDPEIIDYLILGARKAVTGLDFDEVDQLLGSLSITDTPSMGHNYRLLLQHLRGEREIAKQARWTLCEIVRELGTGSSSVEDIVSIAKLFQFAHHDNPHISGEVETPTITVAIEYEKFAELSRTQRTNVCRLLDVLSKSFDIRLAASQNTQAILKHHHCEDLPCVSEWTIIQQGSVDGAQVLSKLDPNGTPTVILEALDAAPDGTLTYTELYEIIGKSDSRIRQSIGDLREYGLVTSFGSLSNKKVSLLRTGVEVLANLQQQSKNNSLPFPSVDPTPNSEQQRRASSHANSRVTGCRTLVINREDSRRPEAADHTAPQRTVVQESNQKYPTGRMSPSMRDAIAACGHDSGSVTIVDDEVDHIDSSLQLFAVDEDHEEVVISTHATTPIDYSVGSAVTLAHPQLIDEALDETTLTTILEDTPVEILSWARQIAYIPSDGVEAQALQDALMSWRKDIQNLTIALDEGYYGNGEFDSRSDLLSEILRQAHGLAGCIVHLLDEAGYKVIRDIRVPSGLNSSKMKDLAESMTHSVAVESRYKEFSVYRQLFEERDGYRSNSFSVQVDAADPYGSYIGSLVLRGGSATRLEPSLSNQLNSFEPHEDAPEFAVPITIKKFTRDAVAAATERVLDRKNIYVTDDAVSVLLTVVGSPFRVTTALNSLAREPEMRDINSDDIRFVLQQLPEGVVFAEAPRSVGQIVMALLGASKPISQSELTERADVTGQTIRNRTDELVDTGLVQVEERSTGVKEWSISAILNTTDSRLHTESSNEVLLGNPPKQTALGDAGEVISSDQTNPGTDNTSDEDEIDLDFSGISIVDEPGADLDLPVDDSSPDSDDLGESA